MASGRCFGYYGTHMAPLLAAIIISNTGSYSSTGGNVVSGGGVVTQGPSESSSYVESIVNSNDNGGSATVHIETNTNGVVQQQTITQPIIPGVPIDIEAATSSGSGSVNIDSYIRTGPLNATGTTSRGRFAHHALGATSSVATSSPFFGTGTTVPAPAMDLGSRIGAFFARLFSFFGL
jgi:hypothetical protein